MIPQAVRQAVLEAVMGDRSWPVVMVGPAGTGKTFSALCLCDAVGGGCLFYELSELCETLIRAQKGELFDEQGEKVSVGRFWCDWQKAPLCVLDEIGVARQKVSEFKYETLKHAIDFRERGCMPLVVMSNLPALDLEQIYDARVVSRLWAGTVIEIEGEDRRVW